MQLTEAQSAISEILRVHHDDQHNIDSTTSSLTEVLLTPPSNQQKGIERNQSIPRYQQRNKITNSGSSTGMKSHQNTSTSSIVSAARGNTNHPSSSRLECCILLMLLLMMGALLIPIVLLFHKTKYSHQESCRQCLENNENQTRNLSSVFQHAFCSHECVLVDPANLDPGWSIEGNATCVVMSAFCGAPECQSKQILLGLRPVPYWIMAVTSFFAVAINVPLNMARYFLWRPLKRKIASNNRDDFDMLTAEMENAKVEDQYKWIMAIRILRWQNLFCAVNPWIWLLAFSFALFHLVYIVIWVIEEGKDEREGNYSKNLSSSSGWVKFQLIYGLWFNSGTAACLGVIFCGFPVTGITEAVKDQLCIDKLSPWYERIKSSLFLSILPLSSFLPDADGSLRESSCCHYQRFISFIGLILPLLLLLPPFLTLTFPASIVFLPIFLLILLVYFGLWMWGWNKKKRMISQTKFRDEILPLGLTIQVLFFRFVGTLMMVAFFQTFTNCATLFFGGGTLPSSATHHDWMLTIWFEFEARDTSCYANALLNNLMLYKLNFVGIVLP